MLHFKRSAPRPAQLLGGVAILVSLAAPAVFGQDTAPLSSGQSTAAQMLRVPVTNLTPGGVTPGAAVDDPDAGDVGAAARGMGHFNAFNCVGCHAANGAGGMGPALSNRKFVYGGSAPNLYLTIAQGRPNGMPAWGSLLPDGVIWDLVAYIRSISREPVTGWGRTISFDEPEIEQVPAEFNNSPAPWDHTQPFRHGQSPNRVEPPQ